MNKRLLLSVVLALVLWQEAFAGAPEFLGKPEVSTTAQPQLLGQMIPDTMGPLLRNFSFKEGWKFLSVNRIHHDHVEVWAIFANLHGTSVKKDATTAEEIREEIINESKNTLRAAIPSGVSSIILTETERSQGTASGDAFTPTLMANLLQTTQEKPFLWDTLIVTLWDNQKALRALSFPLPLWQGEMNQYAERQVYVFEGISEVDCRAYLEAVSKFRNTDGTFCFGAEGAQRKLNDAAFFGNLGFTQDRGTPTSGYDYLVRVAARRNSDGIPDLGAEEAQRNLNDAAFLGSLLGFTKDRGASTSGYDYLEEIAARKNPDGTPGVGAENATQRRLNTSKTRMEKHRI